MTTWLEMLDTDTLLVYREEVRIKTANAQEVARNQTDWAQAMCDQLAKIDAELIRRVVT